MITAWMGEREQAGKSHRFRKMNARLVTCISSADGAHPWVFQKDVEALSTEELASGITEDGKAVRSVRYVTEGVECGAFWNDLETNKTRFHGVAPSIECGLRFMRCDDVWVDTSVISFEEARAFFSTACETVFEGATACELNAAM